MMMRLFRDVPNAYCAVITELPFGDDIRSDYVSVRVYDNNGSLIDTSKCSSFITEERDDYRHFRGREPEEIREARNFVLNGPAHFCRSRLNGASHAPSPSPIRH
jgi:hypothetical protein